MTTDYTKHMSDLDNLLSTDGKDLTESEEEFDNLVLKNIPGWTTVWNILLQDRMSIRKKYFEKVKPMDLQKKIQEKVSELVNEEETLLQLYRKAAEVAKKRADEFKGKTAILKKQIEKDKNFMKMLSFDS